MLEDLVPETAHWGPRNWISVGLLFSVIASVAIASQDDVAVLIGVILGVIGGLAVTIGTIAKGVEVGIRSARD